MRARLAVLRAAQATGRRQRRLLCSVVAAPLLPSPLRGGSTLDSLRLAARRARLSDHAYFDCDSDSPSGNTAPLIELLEADGCRLVAAGRTSCTSYFVADEPAARVRHVVARGVAWRDTRLDRAQLTARLASAWRTQLAAGVPLYAHAGAVAMAEELWGAVEPLAMGALAPSADPPWRLAFSGHSLGGALAVLLCALCRLRAAVPPASLAPVHSFGSPPVLAPAADAPRLLQLPQSAFRSFVLDTDPVPALWGGDGGGGGGGLAAAAVRALGSGFGHAGERYFLAWEGVSSASCQLLAEGAGLPPLQAPPAGAASPSTLLSLWRGALDHNRRSYTDALALLLRLAEEHEQPLR